MLKENNKKKVDLNYSENAFFKKPVYDRDK